MLQIDLGDNKVYYRPNCQKILKFSRFFDFLKMKFKNNACFNLTTKTSKYHLDVSQLSGQCFRGFLLSLLSKKSKDSFSRDLKKFILRVRGRNLKKCREITVCICMSLEKKLNEFYNFPWRRYFFRRTIAKKRWFFSHSRESLTMFKNPM
jgi:hypothetical protein